MTRLLTILMLMAGLSAPAYAQETPPEKPADAAAKAEAAEMEEGEEEGEEEEQTAAAEGVHEAGAKFDYGFSGMLARDNRVQLAPLTLASGKPVASAEYKLKSGGYYRIDITADGSQELALSGGDFFRSVWVNEIVVNDIEIRPTGVHSLEFDDAGTATMSFVAIVPGRYTLSIPGSHGETQQAVFNIQ
ncbi:hypothetical protein [Paracoccus aestuariivivens]|uniref:Uncharacterized protein n=1 Tax=Paracoccus aestuariivivens TaxID=1820333 RepID=A0A6L6J8B4_9RHOB|nr:hypothetical protein [Paracoccus aestuariivivens]MTH78312.1 hypothetical protein [Paracoccus aestuariivivens]